MEISKVVEENLMIIVEYVCWCLKYKYYDMIWFKVKGRKRKENVVIFE